MLNQAKKLILVLFLLHLSCCLAGKKQQTSEQETWVEPEARRAAIIDRRKIKKALCDGHTYEGHIIYSNIQITLANIKSKVRHDESDYGTFPKGDYNDEMFTPPFHYKTLGAMNFHSEVEGLPHDYKQDVVIFTSKGKLVNVQYKRVKPGPRRTGYVTTFTDCDLIFE